MSLLTEKPETREKQIARKLLSSPGYIRDSILNQLEYSTALLWDDEDPQAVLDEIGTKAGALFALKSQFTQLVSALLTAEGDQEGLSRLQAIAAKIKPHTVNDDGTVTLDAPEPEPTLEP